MANNITFIENFLHDNVININELLKSQLESTINDILISELTAFLNYEKYSKEGYNTGNSRNGYYSRTIKTIVGDIKVNIPRDRLGQFENKTLSPYKRSTNDLEATIIHLYKNGVTTREISDLIEKMYGHYYSPQTISNITKIVENDIAKFHNRKLSEKYIAVFCDATMIPVKRGTTQREALCIIMGITPDGHKEILDYSIQATENATIYKEMFQSIRQRGVDEITFVVTDGLPGLDNAILDIYPKALHQRCWVHVVRNISSKVRKKDKVAILNDLKLIYKANTIEVAYMELSNFYDKWSPLYESALKILGDTDSLFSFYSMPKCIRRSIYSTNIIEGLNKHFKRIISHKEQFPSPESLDRFACAYFSEYNAKYSDLVHKGFGQLLE